MRRPSDSPKRVKPRSPSQSSASRKRELSREKRLVYEGILECTRTHLYKKDLMLNRTGKVVSKQKHLQGKQSYEKNGLDQYKIEKSSK